MPRVTLIVAMAHNRVIGCDNRLPWHLPADLAHFRRLTMGKPMIMGRRTWESLPGLLPGRRHIVLTRNRDYVAEGCALVTDVDAALAACGDAAEAMVIGGARVYAEFLPLARRIHLTRVEAEVVGDARFPELPAADWRLVREEPHPADARNRYAYSFVELERV